MYNLVWIKFSGSSQYHIFAAKIVNFAGHKVKSMRIRIGSRVKFLNDTGGGIVRGFKDDKIALVETIDGFEIPILFTELVPDEPVSYEMNSKVSVNSEKITSPQKKEKAPSISFEEKRHALLKGEVSIALVPENEQILHVSNFKLFIINDSNYRFIYVLGFRDSGVYTLVKSGSIEPETKKEISKYSQSEIAKIKEFRLQGIYYKYGLLNFSQPVDLTFNIENISFYKISFFKENDYFNEKALIIRKEGIDLKEAVDKLTESEIGKVSRIKEQAEKKIISKPQKKPSIQEVDLHIEEIVDNHSDLSNGEILEIQMGRFETALETAILSNDQKIIFIHGVGNGILRNELRKRLEKKYASLKYQDASFKEYGYGATMVYLK